MNALVLRSAIVAALGGLLFGFDTAVISGTTQQLDPRLRAESGRARLHRGHGAARHHLRRADRGQAGRPVRPQEGALRDRHPVLRRRAGQRLRDATWRCSRSSGSSAASASAWPRSWRPIYTAEIAPPALRGRLVGLVQFNIVLGILLAYLSNFVIAQPAARRGRLALDVRRDGRSRGGLLPAAVHRAGDPAVAVPGRAPGRGRVRGRADHAVARGGRVRDPRDRGGPRRPARAAAGSVLRRARTAR